MKAFGICFWWNVFVNTLKLIFRWRKRGSERCTRIPGLKCTLFACQNGSISPRSYQVGAFQLICICAVDLSEPEFHWHWHIAEVFYQGKQVIYAFSFPFQFKHNLYAGFTSKTQINYVGWYNWICIFSYILNRTILDAQFLISDVPDFGPISPLKFDIIELIFCFPFINFN